MSENTAMPNLSLVAASSAATAKSQVVVVRVEEATADVQAETEEIHAQAQISSGNDAKIDTHPADETDSLHSDEDSPGSDERLSSKEEREEIQAQQSHKRSINE